MAGKYKSINVLLHDGDIDGIVQVDDFSWVSGIMYSAPREKVTQLLELEHSNNSGVYFLLSNTTIYVGQAMDLKARIKNHISNKDWWEHAILLTTKDDNLTHDAIDYIEARFIALAKKYKRYNCTNVKNETAKIKSVDKLKHDDFIEGAIFLLERILGVYAFSTNDSNKQSFKETVSKKKQNKPSSIKDNTNTEIIDKKGALQFLKENGLELKDRECTYASRKKVKYWANPKKEVLLNDWNIILNDTENRELIHALIPAKTVKSGIKKKAGIFVLRKDMPDKLDINIHPKTLIDMYSKIDINKYIVKKYKY
ncbi:GIY-YIG nuclease family protein [Butyrivibrio sp. CB08]|uniref:GIY-YIG nuclease family protein n=1 Tax=Butyrivibrio sp. CB08 TaxID=2364879 RepID=UPI000EA8A05B|nr:GIY-YIG nuclease family protein [Butyrivibrio sp. CB08]RKM55448.1 GIY-YIG nuclease family protein [Butyrivibrio sp. CB08]